MLTDDQSKAVARYLIAVMPLGGHSYISAWQMASEALEALGYGRETERGIVMYDAPVTPDTTPRWDDICVVVLSAAVQAGRIALAGYVCTEDHGPQTADALTLDVLANLGLVNCCGWTAAADEILWRVAPGEASKTWKGDARLASASTPPSDLQYEIDRIAAIKSDFVRQHELEYLLFERWRLDDGWLTDDRRGRALCIFHDPLAAEAAKAASQILFTRNA